jgi:hypothetical protein
MGKKVQRHRPEIQSVQKDIRRDEHRLCETPGCRNVIAVWAQPRHSTRFYCSRCWSNSQS